jgi:hypothetical protein
MGFESALGGEGSCIIKHRCWLASPEGPGQNEARPRIHRLYAMR